MLNVILLGYRMPSQFLLDSSEETKLFLKQNVIQVKTGGGSFFFINSGNHEQECISTSRPAGHAREKLHAFADL